VRLAPATTWLEDAVLGARFLLWLPAFLRSPVDRADAEAILRRRLATREIDFLALARHAVYPRPESPYRKLVDHAGCRYGDLEGLVRREGLESALRTLASQGVYLTVAELRGREPVVRGGLRFSLEPGVLRNPLSSYHVPGRTGGSRGSSIALSIDLRFIRDVAADVVASMTARGAAGWQIGYWNAGLGNQAVVVERRCGCPLERVG
jgi:hypothetical protein